MHQIARSGLAALFAVATVTVVSAQTPPKSKATAPAPAPAPAAKGTETPKAPAGTKAAAPAPKAAADPLKDERVVATVNGKKVTRGEVLNYVMSQFRLVPGEEKELYDHGVNTVVNTKL